jgi:dipeptidyl-peptidase 4
MKFFNRFPIPVFFLATLAVSACAFGQKALTVEDIYDSEMFSGRNLNSFEWRPDGKAFSYVHRDSASGLSALVQQEVAGGKRTVMIDSARSPVSFGGRREKRFTVPGYSWFPDSRRLLLDSQSDLYCYDIADSSLTRLTTDSLEKRDPAVSPDCRKIAYLKRNNLAVLDVAGKKERRLTKQGTDDILVGRFDWVYEEEFSIRTGFAWSPDSKSIAYWELDATAEPRFPIVDFIPIRNEVEWMRYPVAGDPNATVRVGVVAADGGKTRWMDIGPEKDIYIPRIQWLPGGNTLAIQRLNRKQNRLDLIFADPESGKSRIVLTESDTAGWVDCNDMVRFMKDGNIVWGSERTGRMHLYLVSPDGSTIRPLTGGNWDVTDLCGVSEKENAVYFESTQKSVSERQLYRAPLSGGPAVRLTGEEGTHSIRMAPDCGVYTDRFSSVRSPARTVLCSGDGIKLRILLSGEIPALKDYALAVPEFLTVHAADGLDLDAMLLKPADFDSSRKYPVLIYTYGGPASQIVSNTWNDGMGDLWHQLMLQKGYLVFRLDNRGTFGHGNAFMNRVYRNMGEGAADQVEGVKFLRSLSYVDSNRIGIWGWSGGGWMTCLCLTKWAKWFKAGVAVAPVSDLRNYDTIWTERYMDRPQDNPSGYDESNPVHYIDRYTGGLLIAHGASDDNVHAANSMQLAFGLQNSGKPLQMMVFPRKHHGIEGKKAHVHLFGAMTDFLLKNL